MPPIRSNIDKTKALVFDIETIPLEPGEYPEIMEDTIKRKLERVMKSNPEANPDEERRKIMGTDPFLGRIICIGIHIPHLQMSFALTDADESVLLARFWKNIQSHTGVFIGFNTVRFDCPFIMRRSMVHRSKPTNINFLMFNRYDPYPPHFDVMLQLAGRDSYISLKQCCEIFGVKSPKEGEIKAANVAQAYKDGRIKEIAEYCLKDVVATYELYSIISEYIAQ